MYIVDIYSCDIVLNNQLKVKIGFYSKLILVCNLYDRFHAGTPRSYSSSSEKTLFKLPKTAPLPMNDKSILTCYDMMCNVHYVVIVSCKKSKFLGQRRQKLQVLCLFTCRVWKYRNFLQYFFSAIRKWTRCRYSYRTAFYI